MISLLNILTSINRKMKLMKIEVEKYNTTQYTKCE